MKPTYLAIQNPHPFDERISFVEETHTYTIDGDSSFTSVTTFLHEHFPHFDAEKVIASLLAPESLFRGKMYPNKNKYRAQAFKNIRDENNISDTIASHLLNDHDSPEYKREAQKIADEWAKTSVSGTETHANIEYFYNEIPVENNSKEFAYFMDFHRDFQAEHPNYRPYRTEWTVFYKDLKLAGSIDMVYENIDDGTLMIYDWKRVKSIEYEAFGNATATSPHLPDVPNSNFWHYSLQLNTYKAILESQYGKTVTRLMLVRLYPDAPTYELHECANMQSEVKALFDERREILNTIH
jgi:hypothetical protein